MGSDSGRRGRALQRVLPARSAAALARLGSSPRWDEAQTRQAQLVVPGPHSRTRSLRKKCGHPNDKKIADAHDMAAKAAAAAKARRDLVIIARTDAAASEGLDGAVARAKLYIEPGADAIFPEALNTADMLRAFAARMLGVPLLANMTEFGKMPFFTTAEFETMGYAMVIWPVSSLGMANKAQAELYAAIARDGGTTRSSSGCRRERSSTQRSACMTTKPWIRRSFKRSFRRKSLSASNSL